MVIVILVVVLVVVLAGGGGDDESQSASSTETSAPATSSTAGLTRAEDALSTHVPKAFRGTCSRGDLALANPGLVATLHCDPMDPATSSAYYIEFNSPSSMNAAYQTALDNNNIARDSGGSCSDGEVGEGSYNKGEGRSVCYVDADGAAHIWWTDAELNILGTARNQAGDIGALGTWWSKGRSGPV